MRGNSGRDFTYCGLRIYCHVLKSYNETAFEFISFCAGTLQKNQFNLVAYSISVLQMPSPVKVQGPEIAKSVVR